MLSGTVYDQREIPVESGSVTLLHTVDSSIVRTAIITDGLFKMDTIFNGEYILKINCFGFHERIIAVALLKDTTIRIQVESSAKELKEVQVAAAKPFLTSKDGNLKLTVENTIFETIPYAFELIGYS